MKRIALKTIPLRANRFAGWSSGFHRIFFGLFVIQFALAWMRLFPQLPRIDKIVKDKD